MAPEAKRVRRIMALVAAGVGVIYGLLFRFVAGDFGGDWFPVMSVGFIFGVPLVMGFASVYFAPPTQGFEVKQAVLPALIGLAATLLLAWEGLICIFMWLPLVVVLAIFGGGIAHLAVRKRRPPAAMLVLVLPFMMHPFETQSVSLRPVTNVIDIHASAETVWANIAQVAAITDDEQGFAWSHFIGFPRPIAATIDKQGVGGVRHATFERGVEFLERVTTWDEPRDLGFDIDVGTIPATGLDEHVTVGGKYFDVLEGHYRIEPLARGDVRLHLTSTHRLSTSFNVYAHLWTDFIMSDTQRYILAIIKKRSEL